jgi:hypothetical protein
MTRYHDYDKIALRYVVTAITAESLALQLDSRRFFPFASEVKGSRKTGQELLDHIVSD